MPTGPLPEPLLVGANNLFWAAVQRYVPNLYRSYAQCLPLEPPLPLGILWAQIGGGVLWPSLLPNLASGQKTPPASMPAGRLHPPEEEHNVGRRPSWLRWDPAALHRSHRVHRLWGMRAGLPGLRDFRAGRPTRVTDRLLQSPFHPSSSGQKSQSIGMLAVTCRFTT